jgi:hypothetical protein
MTLKEIADSILSVNITANGIATFMIVFIIWFLLYVFVKAQKKGRLDFAEMITRDGVRVSSTKVLQILGGIVATWVIIKTTIAGNLDWDLLAIYLVYVASVEGFAKFIAAKYGMMVNDQGSERPGATLSATTTGKITVKKPVKPEPLSETIEEDIVPEEVKK